MAIPLIPVITALAAGGSLVPHAAGGMIVSGAGGYVAGTYLGTAAISTLLSTVTASAGAGALILSGAAASLVGSAGIFGTTIGASGLTGVLMSAGIVSSTPIFLPIIAGGAAIGAGYAGYKFRKLKLKLKKFQASTLGNEVIFSEDDAKLMERAIKYLADKRDDDDEEDEVE